jgi:hypothetical protein
MGCVWGCLAGLAQVVVQVAADAVVRAVTGR